MGAHSKWLIFVLFFISCVLLLNIVLHKYITFANVREHADQLQQFVQMHYYESVCFYLVLFIVATIFSVPITAVLTILAGFLFGATAATFYVLVAATTGMAIAFLFVRYVVGAQIQRRYQMQLAWLNKELKLHGHRYLLTLQLLPVTPTALLTLLVGLTQLSLWTVVWTTTVGILPGTLVYTIAGQQLHAVQSPRDLLTWPFIGALIVLALISLLPAVFNRVRGS